MKGMTQQYMFAGIRSVVRRSKPIYNRLLLAEVVGLFSATITAAARLTTTGVEGPSNGMNLEGSTLVRLPFLYLTVNIGERAAA